MSTAVFELKYWLSLLILSLFASHWTAFDCYLLAFPYSATLGVSLLRFLSHSLLFKALPVIHSYGSICGTIYAFYNVAFSSLFNEKYSVKNFSQSPSMPPIAPLFPYHSMSVHTLPVCHFLLPSCSSSSCISDPAGFSYSGMNAIYGHSLIVASNLECSPLFSASFLIGVLPWEVPFQNLS